MLSVTNCDSFYLYLKETAKKNLYYYLTGIMQKQLACQGF